MNIIFKIKKKLLEYGEPSQQGDLEDLQIWREKILSSLYAAGVFLGILAFIPSLFVLIPMGHWHIAILNSIVQVWVIIGFYYRQRISYTIRSYTILFLCFLLGAVIFYTLGPYSGGLIWLFAFSILSGLLMPLKTALHFLALNIVTMIIAGILLTNGLLPWETPEENQIGRMIVLTLSFLLLNGATTVIASVMTDGLELTVNKEREARSELQRREKIIKQSETRFRLLAENVTDIIWTVDRDLKFDYISPSVEKIFGFKVESKIGKPINIGIAPDHLDMAEQYIDEIRANMDRPVETARSFPPIELEQIHKDGHNLWVEVRLSYLTDPAGQINGLIGVTRDISERKRAETMLRESEFRYSQLFNNINDMICTHDLEGKVISCNPAAAEVLGYTSEQLFGVSIPDTLPEKHRAAFYNDYLKKIKSTGAATGTLKAFTSSGEPIYVEYQNILVTGGRGEAFVSGIGRDVTARIKIEREKKKLQEQLLQSQKMEAIGTLASGVAHEFNNLLHTIGLGLTFLEYEASVSEASLEYLDIAKSSVKRGTDLVKSFLTFSRKVDVNFQPVNLNQIVESSLSLLEKTLPRMVDIDKQLDEGICLIKGDASLLEQVLINLAANAVDAMPDGGRLQVRTRMSPSSKDPSLMPPELLGQDMVVLEVEDTGVGMEENMLSNIFNPFFTTKDVGKGTGLGLAIVLGIIEEHGGWIECGSRPGKGSIFTIYLPRLSEPVNEISELPQPAPRPAIEETGTILLVDDEKYVLNLVSRYLGKEGFQVLTADSGEEALDIYQQNGDHIRLIILDLVMPGMGGKACLKQLLQINPEIKVIIASGHPITDMVNEALDMGALEFISKPYGLTDLLDLMNKYLSSTRQ